MTIVGFLEEAPGVRSSTRLFGAVLLVLTTAIVTTIIVYVFRPNPSATVIGALAGVLATLATQGSIAISKRQVVEREPGAG